MTAILKKPLDVLLIEDRPEDAKLILRELELGGFAVNHVRVTTGAEMRNALGQKKWDVILCDFMLPHFDGEAALQLVCELDCDAPFIFVSGAIGEDTAVSAMRSGAQDYVMKDNLARLAPAVERELREAATRREAKRADTIMRESEHKYRHLFESLSDAALLFVETTGQIIDTNAEAEVLLGRDRHEILQLNRVECYAAPSCELAPELGQPTHCECDAEVRRQDGTRVPVRVSTSRVALHGRALVLALLRDVTEQRRSAIALRESEQRFRQVTENIAEVFWLTDAKKTQMIYVSPAYTSIWGRSCESLYEAPQSWIETIHSADRERVCAALPLQITGGYDLEFRIVRPDGGVRWIYDRAFAIKDETGEVYRVAGIARDITQRRQFEEQFRQAQKMEAVGQLAGGIAHDFNNLLTVVQMQCAFLIEQVGENPVAVEGIQQVVEAANHGAALTRQLLTFSRRHMKEDARDLDLADLLGSMTKLLRRILGGHIELEGRFAAHLPLVHADTGMMEQVLMNLVINARDAMPNGGRLVVAVDTTVLDENHVAAHATARPGRFVCITVTDTGSGIPPEIMPRIFEPFFTTKEIGKGTGLGLATVFGIVQHHQGWIEVDSEVGRGTTFTVYLPAIDKPAIVAVAAAPVVRPPRGHETILVVEDEEIVRTLAGVSLRREGYTVLEARSGSEALATWHAHDGAIDLIITDLVMPGGMSGQKLIAELRVIRPSLKVIYATGYNVEAGSKQLQARAGWDYLPKPFSLHDLAAIVRQRLDAKE